jgi:hypothetical protein
MGILPYLKFDVALWPLRKKLDHLNACLGTMAARHRKAMWLLLLLSEEASGQIEAKNAPPLTGFGFFFDSIEKAICFV